MTTAYEEVLRVLGFVDRTDAITEIVAKKVIEIAQTGERDPFRIRARAIADLGIPIMPEEWHTQARMWTNAALSAELNPKRGLCPAERATERRMCQILPS